MILFHHLIYTPALSDGEMIDPVADLSFAEQRTSLIGEYPEIKIQTISEADWMKSI